MEFVIKNPHGPATMNQIYYLRWVLNEYIEELTDERVLKIVNAMAFGTKGETTVLISKIKRWEAEHSL